MLAFSFPLNTLHLCINSYYFSQKNTFYPSIVQLLEQFTRILSTYLIYLIYMQEEREITPLIAAAGSLISEIIAALSGMFFIIFVFHGEHYSLKNFRRPLEKTAELLQIAFPAGLGLVALAPGILSMLYSTSSTEVAAPLLRVLGVAACFAGMTTPMTNLLQAIGKPSAPVKNIAVGALIKIIVNYILVGIPEINIMGAPIGTLCCYMYIAIADLFCIVKYSRVVPSMFITIIKPLAAAGVCAVAAYFSNKGLSILLSGSRMATIGALGVAGVAYIIAIAVFRCITREDILGLPKGEKLAKICVKLHIIN